MRYVCVWNGYVVLLIENMRLLVLNVVFGLVVVVFVMVMWLVLIRLWYW